MVDQDHFENVWAEMLPVMEKYAVDYCDNIARKNPFTIIAISAVRIK